MRSNQGAKSGPLASVVLEVLLMIPRLHNIVDTKSVVDTRLPRPNEAASHAATSLPGCPAVLGAGVAVSQTTSGFNHQSGRETSKNR